jgi:hypothetical protein
MYLNFNLVIFLKNNLEMKIIEVIEPEKIKCPICDLKVYERVEPCYYKEPTEQVVCAHKCGHVEIYEEGELDHHSSTGMKDPLEEKITLRMFFPHFIQKTLISVREFRQLIKERNPEYAIKVIFRKWDVVHYYFFKSEGY